jgi:hypothetical protein
VSQVVESSRAPTEGVSIPLSRQTSHPGAPHVRSDNHRATAFILALAVCASCAGGRAEIAALAAHAPPCKGMGC